MDKDLAISLTDEEWEKSIIPELVEYIRVPNKSPAFDPDWQSNGFMEQVVDQFVAWSQHQNIEGMELDVIRLPKRTPLIFIDIPGDTENTVLLYGHLDKQPEMMGWNEGCGPWKPVLKENKLYGRGGADDGYALFASLLAIKILHKQKIPHARCVVIIEACEESGSYDLPFYIDHLKDRLGKPELVICLDSGCGNYEQLWSTTSLRGLVGGELKVEVLDEGIHSGDISGIIPSSFRILRQLLDRIEDPVSGQILLKECYVDIPNKRIEQAKRAASVLNENVFRRFPIKGNIRPVSDDLVELILNRSWRPTLSYLGASGLPEINDAGYVLRPFTCSSKIVSKKLKELLLNDPPNGAKISFEIDWSVDGWMAPEISPWLEKALDEASENYFNKPSVHIGEGWSIPFMGMLGEKFPEAQFLITGVLGPGSNAHGPNEFLHIPAAKKITCCVAEIIAKHYQAYKKL